MIDWYKSCSYDAVRKRSFHATARTRLRALAAALRLPSGSFEIRSNQGGIAVSGEITLHHDDIYIQVAQSMIAGDTGVLIRTCRDRRDYTGGPNNFASLSMLDDIPALADRVRQVMATKASAQAA
jgi:hypothetical protein